ncbi:TetR/AcrR family transcriptional regulator [Glaciihabitans sp. INWT7]|uniref:TetR/AcrR family transcriptional regulator n=1 Tax=Glaciihabitans sp. INWT7 TaxID=2596912 RepID=UPI002102969E|nr:TetR/AcrR family transcriptional regulator [Glaciihabitans sp. INWT7]
MPIVDTHPIGQRAPWGAGTHHVTVAPAKRRILETANRLFYDDGIRSVGIDRLISESGVTKATFYKHYGSKDRLIVEYISQRHNLAQEQVEELIREKGDPQSALRALIDLTVAEVVSPGFRGCAFINAATEFTDSRHAVRVIVSDHREWYAETLSDLLKQLGHPLPGDGGDELVLARDGVMTGGYAGDPIAATTAYVRVVNRVLERPAS